MKSEDSPKVPGARGLEEHPKFVARFQQGCQAPVRPVDRLAEGDEVPAQGDRWKDHFGWAVGPCGAKTRSGWSCRNPGAGVGGRCLFHGGASTGPTTAAGKARAAQNSRKRQDGGGATVADAGPQQRVQAPAATAVVPVAAPAASKAAAAPVPSAGPGTPRLSFLDQVLDRALSGAARWPDLDRLLDVVDGGKPLTRVEAIAAAGLPASGRLIDLLLARGVILEQRLGLRVVLVRGLP